MHSIRSAAVQGDKYKGLRFSLTISIVLGAVAGSVARSFVPNIFQTFGYWQLMLFVCGVFALIYAVSFFRFGQLFIPIISVFIGFCAMIYTNKRLLQNATNMTGALPIQLIASLLVFMMVFLFSVQAMFLSRRFPLSVSRRTRFARTQRIVYTLEYIMMNFAVAAIFASAHFLMNT